MTRDPPEGVKRQLRQEVGFGCPFPDCRKPILTFHHFDPPWRVEQHHRPDAMIALCELHASSADAGLFSRGELRALKARSANPREVRARFLWAKRGILVRLGGCYFEDCGIVLAQSGEPVVRLTRGPDGVLLTSFRLHAADGSVVLTMDENMFTCEDPDALHDLRIDTGATEIAVWFAQRDIGLDLEFARLQPEGLRGLLRADRERALAGTPSPRQLAGEWGLSPEEVERLLSQPPSWIDQLPPRLRRAYASEDPVAALVMEWALGRCLDDEGRIPVLSFRNLRLYDQGRAVTIRDAVPPGGVRYTSFLGW